MNTLEKAFIRFVDFGGYNGTETTVRGYQNFTIRDDGIVALPNDQGNHAWTDTKVKSNFFDGILADVNPGSYADFGSNLGYYVYHAALQGIPSMGLDYNAEYTNLCRTIQLRHSISGAEFQQGNLQQWQDTDDRYDLVTVFNVIHHLYNRTEKYQNMQNLVQDFANKSKHAVLFEFPTERDKKGYKWTMDTDYSEALFVDAISKCFDRYTRMPGQTEHRPYYLCVL